MNGVPVCTPTPHPNRAILREPLRELRRGHESTGRCRKGEEECVPLRIDLDATVVGACLADRRTVRSKRVRVLLRAQASYQQRRGALDVGKDEGDGPDRKFRAHAGIIRRSP